MGSNTLAAKIIMGLVVSYQFSIIKASPSLPAIPLKIVNTRSFQLQDVPVITGIPIPEDLGLLSTEMFNIADASGSTIPSQFTVTARWGGAANEPSKPIKWVLTTFFAEVPANGTAQYTLTLTVPNATSTALTISLNSAERMIIETGAARFTIDKTAFSLFERVEVHGIEVTDSTQNGVVLVDEHGERHSSFLGSISEVRVMEAGPIRLRVMCSGSLGSLGGSVGLDYRTIIDFYADQSYVKMLLTIGNHQNALYDEGYDVFDYGGGNSVWFQFCGLEFQLSDTAGGLEATIPDLVSTFDDEFCVYQDSSGTDYWSAYDASDHPRPNSYCQFRGFKVFGDGMEEDAGDHFAGWMDVSSSQAGIAAGIRDFWQLFPKAITAHADGLLQIEIFPDDSLGLFNFRVGEEKTHEMVLCFHDGNASSAGAANRVRGLMQPLLALPQGQWISSSQVLPEFALEPVPAAQRHGQAQWLDAFGLYAYLCDRVLKPDPLYTGPYTYYYDYHSLWESSPDSPSSIDYFNAYGWSWYGNQALDFEAYAGHKAGPFNGKYNFDFGAWIQYLRTGDERWRTMAEAFSRYLEMLMLHDVETSTGYDIWRWKDAVFGHSQHNETGNSNGQRNRLGPVTDTTYGAPGALLHYYLTGDPISRRYVEKTGEHMMKFYSDEYYDSKRFLAVPVLCGSGEREYANALTTLVEAYRHTGDARYQQLAGEIIDHFAPSAQPWIHGPKAGASGYLACWQLLQYVAALGRYAQVTEEFGQTDAASIARAHVVDFTNWVLTFGTRQYEGIFSTYYWWWLNGDNDSNHTGMINNWMLLMADVCAYAYKFSGQRVYMSYGAEFFSTAVNDPTYLGDAPTYASAKEAVNQVTFGHIYMHFAETLDELPPDDEAPFVSLEAPSHGETISGEVDLAVTAWDDREVMQVIYMLNDDVISSAFHPPFDAVFPSTHRSNGTYTLHAKAYDHAWNSHLSEPVSVTIDNLIDLTPPTIVVTHPPAAAVLSGSEVLSAQATDNEGVQRVQFFLDGTAVGTSSSAPYTTQLNTLSFENGSHEILATAEDWSGNVGESQPLSVWIENVDNDPPVLSCIHSPEWVQVSTPVTFDATNSTDPEGDSIALSWNFGDGSQATGEVVTHSFTDEGVFSVTLTGSDGIHQVSLVKEIEVWPRGTLTSYEIPPAQDAFIYLNGGNYGGDPVLHVYNGLSPSYRSLLEFDLNAFNPPGEAQLISAKVSLEATYVENSPNNSVFQIQYPWSEHTVTWEQRDGMTPWNTPGGDFDSDAPLGEVTVNATGRVAFDITTLASQWIAGTATNAGIIIASPDSQAYVWTSYASRDHSDPSLRPHLILTVLEAEQPCHLTIIDSPAEVVACGGQPASFSVSVTGDEPLDYQWLKDGAPLEDNASLSGVNDATLQIDSVTLDDAGLYRCDVSNPCGTATSESAPLTIDGVFSASIFPAAQAQGLEAPGFSAHTDCAVPPVQVSWTVTPDTPHSQAGNAITFDIPPVSRCTEIEAQVADASTRETALAFAVLLKADHPQFFDYNGDASNDLLDLWLLATSWNHPMAVDADGNGWIDVRDLLFIHLP